MSGLFAFGFTCSPRQPPAAETTQCPQQSDTKGQAATAETCESDAGQSSDDESVSSSSSKTACEVVDPTNSGTQPPAPRSTGSASSGPRTRSERDDDETTDAVCRHQDRSTAKRKGKPKKAKRKKMFPKCLDGGSFVPLVACAELQGCYDLPFV